jgi:hypothetical protein
MNLVDPRPVHVGQNFNVRIGRQKLRLDLTDAFLSGAAIRATRFCRTIMPDGRRDDSRC